MASGGKVGKGCKVVVCGHALVGKTSILEQLVYGSHTIGPRPYESQEDIFVASVETGRGAKEQLRLYDTVGLGEGLELPEHYYAVMDGFVLVYGVDSLESFRRVEALKKEIDKARDKREVTVIVLGNKTDLTGDAGRRQVDQEEARLWARVHKVALWEVSATERASLMEPFTALARRLTQPRSRATFPLPGRKSKGAASNDS